MGLIAGAVIAGFAGYLSGGIIGALVLGGLTLLSGLALGATMKPKFSSVKPASLSQFSIPTVTLGRAVPYIVGRVKIPGNIVWYGHLKADPIKKKFKSGKHSKTVTVGYRYYLDLLIALGMGELILHKVYKQDRVVEEFNPPLGLYADEQSAHIGRVLWFNGSAESDIPPDDRDSIPTINALSPALPASIVPGIAWIGLKGFYAGKSTYLPPLAFEVERDFSRYKAIFGNLGNINENPIVAVYDILTRVVPSSQLDLNAFKHCASLADSMGIGVNIVIDDITDVKSAINKILEHTGFMFYVTKDGYYSVRYLSDDDAVVATFTDFNVKDLALSTPTTDTLPAKVKARITAEPGRIDTIELENPALTIRGKTQEKTFDLTHLTKEGARKALARIQRHLLYPSAKLSLSLSVGEKLVNVGDVIRVISQREGIDVYARVLQVERLTRDYKIVAEAMVYKGFNAINAPPPSPALPATECQISEYPTHKILAVDASTLLVLFPRLAPCHILNRVYYSTTDTFEDADFVDLSPAGLYTLLTTYPSDTYDIDDMVGFEIRGDYPNPDLEYSTSRRGLFVSNRAFLIDHEFMKAQTVEYSPEKLTIQNVWRGVYYTKKEKHYTGAKVWVFDPSNSLLAIPPSSTTLYLRVVPVTTDKGEVNELATTLTLSIPDIMEASAFLHPNTPIPPECVIVDARGDNAVLSLHIRNRVSLGAGLRPETYADIVPFPSDYRIAVNNQSVSPHNISVPKGSTPHFIVSNDNGSLEFDVPLSGINDGVWIIDLRWDTTPAPYYHRIRVI